MAKYKVTHPWNKTWICINNNLYYWGPYEESVLFQNYFKAKAAVETLPIERGMYNLPVKLLYMKISE